MTSRPFVSSRSQLAIYRSWIVLAAKRQRYFPCGVGLILWHSLHHRTSVTSINLRLFVEESLLKFVIFKVHPPFFVFSKSSHPMIASNIDFLKLTWCSNEFLICLSLLTFVKQKVTFWALNFQIVSSLITRLRDTALWFSFPVSSRELVSSVSMYTKLSLMLFTAPPSVALKSQCASLWAVGYLVGAI